MASSWVVVWLLFGAPKAVSTSRLSQPVPSAFPTGQMLHPQMSWLPFAKLTLVYQCSPWIGRAASWCGPMDAGQWGRITSLDQFSGLLVNTVQASGCHLCRQGTLWAPFQLAGWHKALVLFSRETSVAARNFPSLPQDSAFVPFELHRVPLGPFLLAFLGPSEWQPCPWVHQPVLPVWCHVETWIVCTCGPCWNVHCLVSVSVTLGRSTDAFSLHILHVCSISAYPLFCLFCYYLTELALPCLLLLYAVLKGNGIHIFFRNTIQLMWKRHGVGKPEYVDYLIGDLREGWSEKRWLSSLPVTSLRSLMLLISPWPVLRAFPKLKCISLGIRSLISKLDLLMTYILDFRNSKRLLSLLCSKSLSFLSLLSLLSVIFLFMKVENRTFFLKQSRKIYLIFKEWESCVLQLSYKRLYNWFVFNKRIHLSKKILLQIRFWRHQDQESKTLSLSL